MARSKLDIRLEKWAKIFGYILLGIVGFVIVSASFLEIFNNKTNYKEVAESADFKALLKRTLEFDSTIYNIALSPGDLYFKVDELIVNPAKRTYGYDTSWTYYNHNYRIGDENRYKSLDLLLTHSAIPMDSVKLYAFLYQMNRLKIKEIMIANNQPYFKFRKTRYFHEEGLLYSVADIKKDTSIHFQNKKHLGGNIYFVATQEK